MVIKKMNEITDISNKNDDTRDMTDVTDPASDQEKTVEVRNLEVILEDKTNFK